LTQPHSNIRDVARLAGVSHQTVSRVINGSDGVNPDTRAKVQAAIAELGYRPSAIARSMARGRTSTLACIAPNLTDYTFASIIESAEAEARQHGYFLLSSSAPDEASFDALLEELVAHRRIDGTFVINPYADGRHKLIPKNFPVVFVGARPRREAVDSVALDDEGVARDATQHLIALGHRRIAVVTGPQVEDCSQDRNSGYESALHAAGIKLDPSLIIEGDWSASSGYDALQRLSKEGNLPTAVFAQNDRMAMGVLRAARDMNLNIPEQLAVIGVDDMPLASYFDPPLTTMRQDMARIGRDGARLLIRAIVQPESQRLHLRLPAELIVRHSTQKP
jgi:DNA-binding LacI/PurR family transcriptional regulator